VINIYLCLEIKQRLMTIEGTLNNMIFEKYENVSFKLIKIIEIFRDIRLDFFKINLGNN
jgi:hypothetical protein